MALVAKDPQAMPRLQRAVKALAAAGLTDALAKRLGATALKLLSDQFKRSVNPYGETWAPVFRDRKKDRRARARRAKAGKPVLADRPLVDTGRLRAAATGKASNDSSKAVVRVVIPVEYASYHQSGTRFVKRRQMVPEASTGGLGPIWSKAFEREAEKLILERMKKGGV